MNLICFCRDRAATHNQEVISGEMVFMQTIKYNQCNLSNIYLIKHLLSNSTEIFGQRADMVSVQPLNKVNSRAKLLNLQQKFLQCRASIAALFHNWFCNLGSHKTYCVKSPLRISQQEFHWLLFDSTVKCSRLSHFRTIFVVYIYLVLFK